LVSQALAKRYKGKFTEDKFANLQYFYMLVPCLTMEYIQSLLVAKEKLLKKNYKGGYISDDGFIIGLAYLVEILNQTKQFEETLWFEEVKEKGELELSELEAKYKALEEEKKKKVDTLKDDVCQVYFRNPSSWAPISA